MSCNEDLFHLVEDLIKLPDKTEVPLFSLIFIEMAMVILMYVAWQIASSCVTAAVLMANIVTDSPNLASRLSQGKRNCSQGSIMTF